MKQVKLSPLEKQQMRKPKSVACHGCGAEFLTRRRKDRGVGYECYPCQRSSFEDWVYNVSFPGCTTEPAHITQWRYYEADLHGGLENEAS